MPEKKYLTAKKKTSHKSYRYEVKIKSDRCKGCELCIFYCPVGQITLSSGLNRRGVKSASVKKENKCIGCGFCVLVCPDSCVELGRVRNVEGRRSDKGQG